MKTGTSSLLPRDETIGEKHPAQSQQTKMPTLLLFKKTPSRKTSELGEAIIVTTDRKTDIPSHVALTKTGRCINCQQQQSFPPHRTTKSIYIGNWPKRAIYGFCLLPGEMVFQRLSVQQIHWGIGNFPTCPASFRKVGKYFCERVMGNKTGLN